MTDNGTPEVAESPWCSVCRHARDAHAYSDEHCASDWMNDDGSINYATHCHQCDHEGRDCPDWNGQGRPRAEGDRKCSAS